MSNPNVPNQLEPPPKPPYIHKSQITTLQKNPQKIAEKFLDPKAHNSFWKRGKFWKSHPDAKAYVRYWLEQAGQTIPDYLWDEDPTNDKPPKPKNIHKATVAAIEKDALKWVNTKWLKTLKPWEEKWKHQPGAVEYVIYHLQQQGHPIPDYLPLPPERVTPPTGATPPGTDGGGTKPSENGNITHLEIQWLLLSLGNELDLDLWVANNDRNKSFQGNVFSKIPRLIPELPIQFHQNTQKTLELIDVLWLKRNSFIAAFEIEHTTSIYSGLLRMSDLVALQPDVIIDLYIVAPDKRREKVKSEITRPTFAKLGLPKKCRYISYSRLTQKIEQARPLGLGNLKYKFLNEIAEDMSK